MDLAYPQIAPNISIPETSGTVPSQPNYVTRKKPGKDQGSKMADQELKIKAQLQQLNARDGGAGGQGAAAPPPIRAVCRHEFGHRVYIIRAKHNTCLNNTKLGSVTAVNGKKTRIYGLLLELTDKILPPPQNLDPGKFLLLPPPPTESIRAKLGLPPPPQWMLARTPMLVSVGERKTYHKTTVHTPQIATNRRTLTCREQTT